MSDIKEFDDSIKLTKNAFVISGIEIGDNKRVMTCLFYFNLIWLYTDVFAEFLWLIEGISMGKSLDELSMVAPCTTICLLGTAKALNIFFNRNTLKIAVFKLRDMHPTEIDEGSFERTVAKESIKFLNSVVLFLTSCCVVLVVNFCSLPLMLMGYDYYYYGETDLKLPFFSKYMFDVYGDAKIWSFVYFHQIWSTVIVCMNVYATDTMFYAFCTYIRMHFRILCHHFENVVCDTNDGTRQKLRKCVRRHQDLIQLVEQMELLYSKSNLFNIISSSLLICLSGFNITISPDTKVLLMFVPFLTLCFTQISLMCFFGDLLTGSSTKISDAIYNSRWYGTSPDIKKSVLLIIFRARKPCKITAANFAVLSLTALTTILSRSWSCFALLRTMYD